MPIQLRTDTSAAEHNSRKSWPLAPNPVHFADCTRFLRTTAPCHVTLLKRCAAPLFQLLKLRLFVAADSLLIESLRLAA